MELVGGSSDRCQSSLLYDSAKGVRTLLLTLVGLHVCILRCFLFFLNSVHCETFSVKLCSCSV